MTGIYDPKTAPKEAYDVSSLGGGVKLTRQQQITFSLQLAEKMISGYDEFEQDRKLRDTHVDYLTKCAIRGTFRWENIILAIAYCRENKKTYRINGQHCSWMRLSLGKGYESPKVTKRIYECATFNDVRYLYSAFDRNAIRTKANVAHVWLLDCEEFPNISKSEISQLVSGYTQWKHEGDWDKRKHDADEIAYLLRTEYHNVSNRVLDLLRTDKSVRFVRRASIVAAMFATSSKHVNDAKEFWEKVITGTNITERLAPERKLRDMLMTVTLGRRNKIAGAKNIGEEDLYRSCLLAWNAHRNGRTLNSLRPGQTKEMPKVK